MARQVQVMLVEHEQLARWTEGAWSATGARCHRDFAGDLPTARRARREGRDLRCALSGIGARCRFAALAIADLRLLASSGWQPAHRRQRALTIELGRNEPGERLSSFVLFRADRRAAARARGRVPIRRPAL